MLAFYYNERNTGMLVHKSLLILLGIFNFLLLTSTGFMRACLTICGLGISFHESTFRLIFRGSFLIKSCCILSFCSECIIYSDSGCFPPISSLTFFVVSRFFFVCRTVGINKWSNVLF